MNKTQYIEVRIKFNKGFGELILDVKEKDLIELILRRFLIFPPHSDAFIELFIQSVEDISFKKIEIEEGV